VLTVSEALGTRLPMPASSVFYLAYGKTLAKWAAGRGIFCASGLPSKARAGLLGHTRSLLDCWARTAFRRGPISKAPRR